jgi:hypothetical protein
LPPADFSSQLWAYSYEPRRLRFNQSIIAFWSCVVPGFLAVGIAGAPWGVLVFVTSVLGLAWSVKRAWRLGLWASETCVVSKNFWRTRTFDWSDVTDIGVGAETMGILPQPAWAFRLASGKVVRAQATPFKPRDQQREWEFLVALAPEGVSLFPPSAS